MRRDLRKSFLRKIVEGMNCALDDAYLFSGQTGALARPEYLMTVNVAKKIAELNEFWGHPYHIALEEKTSLFARACFDSSPRSNKLSSIPLIGRHDVIRKRASGRIDVAVYTRPQVFDVSFAAVEIKGFNPSRRVLLRDLKRNYQLHFISDKGAPNCLEITVLAYLVSDPKASFEGDEPRARTVAYCFGSETLKKLKPEGINVGIVVKTLEANLVNRIEYDKDPDNHYWDYQFEENCHNIAVLLYLYR